MLMFELVSPYSPAGDQPPGHCKADGRRVVGGGTSDAAGRYGSGKTFSIANVIREREQADSGHLPQQDPGGAALRRVQRLFSKNARSNTSSVTSIITKPEAYIPRTDTFIEKDSSINEEIERLRLSTMSSLFSRADVVVVASVSCIYGIGKQGRLRGDGDPRPRRRRNDARPFPAAARGSSIYAQRH